MKYRIFFYNHESGYMYDYRDCPGTSPWTALVACLLREWNKTADEDHTWLPDGLARELIGENSEFQWAALIYDDQDRQVPIDSPAQREGKLRDLIRGLDRAITALQTIIEPLAALRDLRLASDDVCDPADDLRSLCSFYSMVHTNYVEERRQLKEYLDRIARSPQVLRDITVADGEDRATAKAELVRFLAENS